MRLLSSICVRLGLVMACASASVFSMAGLAAAVETVTLLDRGEPHASMVADGGVLWVAQNRKNFNADYRLQAFAPDGRLVDEVTLSHAMWNMVQAAPGTVMMTGINPDSRLTNYTTARLDGGRIRLKTTEIALGGFINFWIASFGGKHYFADMGGNPNDDQLGVPAQTIFASTGTNARYLSTRLRMPLSGLGMNQKLYLVSHESIGNPKSSLVEVDPISMQKRVLISSATAAYTGIKILPGTQDLVTSALAENKIVIVDSKSGQMRRELRTKGYTRSFEFFGHCVLAGDDENNIVEIFDLNSSSDLPVMAEEVALTGDEFSGIKSIAVDQSSGMIFARASLACNPMMEACDKDYNRVVSFGAEAAERLRKACQ
jgi:hypothetical protein